MILSRISTAVREQNWLAVTIEFVIVIAGVVIGFQISAASERARERSELRELLVRTHVDLAPIIEFGPQSRRVARERAQEFEFALNALIEGELAPDQADRFNAALGLALAPYRLREVVSLDLLGNPDVLALISKTELRDDALNLIAGTRAREAVATANAETLEARNYLYRTVRIRVPPGAETGQVDQAYVEGDFDALASDDAAINAFAQIVFVKTRTDGDIEEGFIAIRDFYDSLEAYLYGDTPPAGPDRGSGQ